VTVDETTVVDLDAADDEAAGWSFSDLRRQSVPADLYSPQWQVQRRELLAQRAAVREAHAARERREAVTRNVSEARCRVAQRRSSVQTPPPVAKAQRRAQPAARPTLRAAEPGPVVEHPVPPPGETLLRYAKVGETTIAVTTAPLPFFRIWRWTVWIRRDHDAAWEWVFSSHNLAEARAIAERVAKALNRVR
jgi:hypothetical protein